MASDYNVLRHGTLRDAAEILGARDVDNDELRAALLNVIDKILRDYASRGVA